MPPIEQVSESLDSNEEPKKDLNRIIDTPITWSMVEEDFQKTFNTKAKIGEGRLAKMIGDGRGFISLIALIDFDWDEEDPKLPKRVVLKITTCDKLRLLCEKVIQMNFESTKSMAGMVHDAEMNLYEKAHQHPDFVRDMRVPKYYGGRKFDFEGIEAGYFAMEHFENFVHRHFYHNVQESGALDVITILGKLGAFSLKHPEVVDSMDTKWMDETMEEFINIGKMEAGLDAIAQKYPDRKDQVDVMKRMLPIYQSVDTYNAALEPFKKAKLLCHGDLWPGNMIWDKNEKGEYHVRNLIDWQVVHMGTSVEDLVRILTSAVNPENYKNKRDFYIEHYYKTLKEEAGDLKLPWDNVEQLIEEYEKFLPLIACAFFPMFLQFEDLLFRTCDESEKEECLKCYYDKFHNSLDEAERLIKKWY